MMEVTLAYDGSFEGLLSTIYDVYDRKLSPTKIEGKGEAPSLFSTALMVHTDADKARRVLSGIIKRSDRRTARFIYEVFLSEQRDIEVKLLHLVRHILAGRASKISDFSDAVIVDLHRIKKMVGREVHRMHAFVRFQETKDDIWACETNPDFNVLPLIGKHFCDRYPTLEWMIFDTVRRYGIHYAGSDIDYVTFDDEAAGDRITAEALTDQEKVYQRMWQHYFKSVNIEERNNPKLHLRHVPKRYWKYLIEKR